MKKDSRAVVLPVAELNTLVARLAAAPSRASGDAIRQQIIDGFYGPMKKRRVREMTEKSFADMSLNEVFDVEQKHSANLGRTVASIHGLKRHKAAMQLTLKSGTRRLKCRKTATVR